MKSMVWENINESEKSSKKALVAYSKHFKGKCFKFGKIEGKKW